ncbi:SDR family NAD(P)-dependent oxidoreductase [Bradyrhizobium sp. AS23.2]|uniref:SDR family NAD(P)-dependent oxidoreductase n=1 Tax=Bradyrhizobium sp. AS23.2 TaxID=1680155 RepID=UPI00093EDD64|nr:SDR family NAD(P)-dependent oxidoreductase [Bradyrhizobium sp. AS23.2]OKO81092.1 3-hydroxyacyl-CoA dehydrogenase [Bradyrhizobium sp. AS23.2]
MSKALEGKVVLVTGAGRGIGREIALLAAQEGAAVVVNDLGGSALGAGSSDEPANEVVREIKAAGGRAIANTESITDPEAAERMVRLGVDSFGRIDAIINNAGILRDRIFHRMTHDDWTTVINVHLHGYFNVSKAAVPFFKEQNSGSFVHFTSTSGLVGNFGQANYMAAKLGVVGLSKAIALDMARFNVRSNCVSPFAWSRLVGSIPTETEAERERVERVKAMTAAKIAPLTVFLASDLSQGVTGQIFGSRKNELFLFSQNRPIRSAQRSDGWTPQTIAEHMLPAFKSSFYPLERSGDIFCWDPI